MPTIIYRLNHYHPLDSLGSTDRVGHNSKTIGEFSSVEAAARAHQAVADAEGFRDWPDGYRLHEYVVDQPFFREGFELHPEGDVAIAGDSSGDVGNDEDVEERGSEPPLAPDEWLYGDPDLAHGHRPGGVWELNHYKIGARSDEGYMETGGKVIGLFSTAEKAKATIAALRDKPGFKLWPGGWRIYPSDIDEVGWEDGFVTETWFE
jgi:hypothetical protein